MLQEDDFVKIWPSGEDGTSVFDGKVAELTEDGRFLFSEVKWNTNEEGMILTSVLVLGIGAAACANYSTPTEITPTVASWNPVITGY